MANSRNYRFPTGDDDPNVPVWMDRLAYDVAKDVDGVEEGTTQPTFDPSVAFSVVDEDGRRTWLEADQAGRPTPYSAGLIAEAAGDQINAGSGLTSQPEEITSLAFAVVDEDGRRTELEVGPDGRFTERVVASLGGRLRTAGTSSAVVASGDSMTGGAFGTPWPGHLEALTGWAVLNMGVGGENTSTIAGRMGGRPMLASIPSGSIPASGPVTITLASDDGISPVTPLLQQHAGVNPVRLLGVEGVLSIDDTTAPHVYTFTRSAAGSAVPVNYPTPLITQAARDYRSGIHVMWWGTNDATQDMAHVIGRQRAQIEHLTDPARRYLVLSLTVQTAAWRATSTLQWRQEYGRRFIDLGAYLSSPAAMEDAGLTPTQADLDAQATGSVPPSLKGDNTHLNNAGNLLVAKQVRNRIQEMGWLS